MPMSAHCCRDHAPAVTADPLYRRVLWIALAINAGMFLTEVVAGTLAGSVALQADALDFLADAANYGIRLCVLGMALVWRARAALVKGDRKSTRLNSSHSCASRMPSSACKKKTKNTHQH